MTIDEKLQLVAELWNSIAADQNAIPLTAPDREDLDHRLAEFEADEDMERDTKSVLDEIRQRP